VSGALRIAVVLLVAAAATIVANVVLLGVAAGRHEPVGRLTPLASVAVRSAPAPPSTPRVSAAPPPRSHDHEDD
jgi:hypothetical protein